MASGVDISTAINQASKTQQQSVGLAKDFNQFLQLLTTQLQNQDPLSPLDTNEFTNQLVQFSQVEQSINTNQKLDSLVQLQLTNALSSSLGYVGLDTSYVSAEFSFDGTAPVDITTALPKRANKALMSIVDESGRTIYSRDLSLDAGKKDLTWNGEMNGVSTLAPKGTYKVRVDAIDEDDAKMDITTVVTGRVKGIESQNGQIFLLIGERAVPLANVINAKVPPVPQQTTNS